MFRPAWLQGWAVAFVAAILAVPASVSADTWSAPRQIMPSSADVHLQGAVASRRGDALIVWNHIVDSTHQPVEGVRKPAGGDFGPIQTFTPAGQSGIFAWAGMNARGDTALSWVQGGSAFHVDGLLFDGGAPDGRSYRLGDGDCTADEADVGIDAAGNATQFFTDCSHVWAADRPFGGSFGAPQAVPQRGGEPHGIGAAVSPGGTAVVSWWDYEGVYAAVRDPGGAWRSVTLTSKHDSGALRPEPTLGGNIGQTFMAINSRGDAVVSWEEPLDDRPHDMLLASYKRAGGDWQTPVVIDDDVSGTGSRYAVSAIDEDGTATIAYDDHFPAEGNFAVTGRDRTFTAPEYFGDMGCTLAAVTDATGATYVAWERYDMPCTSTLGSNSGQIHVAIRPPGGRFDGSFDRVGNGADEIIGPWMTPYGRRGVLITWQEGNAHDGLIYEAHTVDPGPAPAPRPQTAGTASPQAEPATAAAPASAEPALRLSLGRLRIRGREVTVRPICALDCTVTVTLRHAGRVMARRRARLSAGRAGALSLNARGRRRHWVLTVVAGAGGQRRTISRALTLRA